MEPRDAPRRVLIGYLSGIVLGAMSITLLFLGMRAVMDVGGACADGGPYVSAQPCPTGVPLALIGGMFGLFGSAGLIVWFGSRIGKVAASIVALGWPALFIALGFNFLDYAFHPPDIASTPVWGWFIPGILFWLMGGAPVAVGVLAWRETRAGRPGNRLSQQVATSIPSRPVTFDVLPLRSRSARPSMPSPAPSPAPDLVDALARLAEMHEAGDLTDDEFATAKRDLLGGREMPR